MISEAIWRHYYMYRRQAEVMIPRAWIVRFSARVSTVVGLFVFCLYVWLPVNNITENASTEFEFSG